MARHQAGSFVLANPLLPVHVGGCMGGALGVPIAIFDHDLDEGSSDGAPLPAGTPGDLVATGAFPNVPLFLWGDAEPAPGPKYRGSYFARFGQAWAQGDFCVAHPVTGAVLMLGRSDGVLNPGGIRFGSADIYAVVERCFAADVADSLCVGQRRARDVDEAVLLFLVMRPGREAALDGRMVAAVKATIARELTKRHVPRYVFAAPEIPVSFWNLWSRPAPTGLTAARSPSTAKRSSFPSRPSCRAKRSSRAGRCSTRRASTSSTASRGSRTWASRWLSCD